MERDLQSDTFHNDLVISTHTLTWSVTQELKKLYMNLQDFNSHAHVERDEMGLGKISDIKHFNSHAHVERDERTKGADNGYFISTHTLTWSVTLTNVHKNKIAQFQLTRSRGA